MEYIIEKKTEFIMTLSYLSQTKSAIVAYDAQRLKRTNIPRLVLETLHVALYSYILSLLQGSWNE